MTLCLLVTLGASAQETTKRQKGERLSPEKFIEMRAKRIVNELELSSQTAEKFTALYTQYSNALMAERDTSGFPRRQKLNELSDSEIDRLAENFFESQSDAIEVKEEYYEKFRKFLSPQQVLKIYEVERNMHDKINAEKGKRKDGEGKGDKKKGPKTGN